METLGGRLRRLRIEAGLSQRQLAQEVGVTFPHISKVEAGKEPASAELLVRIAKAVDADADELLLLADRLPDDLHQVVKQKADLAPRFLRSWKAGKISDGQVEALLRGQDET